MDGRQWSRETEVRRDDQFTRAPEFRDVHDSDHLPMWGRFSASWHGMSGRRRAVLTASLVALSLVGGAGLFTTLDDFGGEVGTRPEAHGPLAAEEDPSAGLDGSQALPDDVAGPAGAAGGHSGPDNPGSGLVNGTADPGGSLSLAPAPPS